MCESVNTFLHGSVFPDCFCDAVACVPNEFSSFQETMPRKASVGHPAPNSKDLWDFKKGSGRNSDAAPLETTNGEQARK